MHRMAALPPASVLTQLSANKVFGGYQKIFSHESLVLGCTMKFGVYFPPQYEDKPLPVIFWLSGLTCSEANFIEKSGAQRYAAEHGVILVNPDTSPRNLNIDGDSKDWDFGVGAGFYVNATQEPWKTNYQMFNYVNYELHSTVADNFQVTGAQSIMGHSMGGHGALVCALKLPGLYKAVSAFAPISNPINCPWGQKAFSGYLGPMETGNWEEWDASKLVKKYNGPPLPIFVDQGTGDKFYKEGQLLPENLVVACKDGANLINLVLEMRDSYDHSYYYISSFIGDHIKRHATILNAK